MDTWLRLGGKSHGDAGTNLSGGLFWRGSQSDRGFGTAPIVLAVLKRDDVARSLLFAGVEGVGTNELESQNLDVGKWFSGPGSTRGLGDGWKEPAGL